MPQETRLRNRKYFCSFHDASVVYYRRVPVVKKWPQFTKRRPAAALLSILPFTSVSAGLAGERGGQPVALIQERSLLSRPAVPPNLPANQSLGQARPAHTAQVRAPLRPPAPPSGDSAGAGGPASWPLSRGPSGAGHPRAEAASPRPSWPDGGERRPGYRGGRKARRSTAAFPLNHQLSLPLQTKLMYSLCHCVSPH